MSRIWNFAGSDKASPDTAAGNGTGAGTGTALAAPPVAPDGYWGPEDDDEFEPIQPYAVRPVRPVTQLAARVGLWLAVGLGAVGGIAGLVRPVPKAATDDVVDATLDAVNLDTGLGVPAPVAGTAERAIEAWLEASDEEQQEDLRRLFVERPILDHVDTSRITVLQVQAVAGERLYRDGYWTVTVAVDLYETTTSGETLPQTTWYVEVGIVGDVGDGLKALTTPAVVPAPLGVPDRWYPAADTPGVPPSDSPVANMVEGFLTTLLTGNGDLSLYLLPDVRMRAADPAPFVDVELTGLTYTEITEEGQYQGGIRIWAIAEVETPGGSTHVVGYEIIAFKPIDRWQVKAAWGAPEVVAAPEDTGDTDAESTESPGSGETPTTTADDGTSDTGSDPYAEDADPYASDPTTTTGSTTSTSEPIVGE